MNKKIIILFSLLAIIVVLGTITLFSLNLIKDDSEIDISKEKTENTITAMVIGLDDNTLTIQDSDHIIYMFDVADSNLSLGDIVEISYKGELDKNKSVQSNQVLDYKTVEIDNVQNEIPKEWQDNGIFKDYYLFASKKLKELTLDEKIAQLLLVRYPDSDAVANLEKYQFGGYVFYEKDFKNKTTEEVKAMMNALQSVAKIPILTAVDEEGGTVVRVSSNSKLAKERFKSPRDLYLEGGFTKIETDTIDKSLLLANLGLNLNLAPVVDVSTNANDYMYKRTLGENTNLTSTYAKTVIKASKGLGVSYTLKHFPGYGNNADTHTGATVDKRTYDDILKNDLPPFKAGIAEGAEAVLVSHNTVTSIDNKNPASLSQNVHNLLRNELGFTGIIITDDLAMGAISTVDNATVKAILAGNDLLITTDYEESISDIKQAINDNTIDESLIDKLAFRVLAWKYYKGLIFENQK